MINIAKKYLSLGYSVLPIHKSLKKPAIDTWKRLQSFLLTSDEAERAFDGDLNLAIIFGQISGNLECLDFDNHLNNAHIVFEQFKSIIDTFNLPYETTRNGGYHVFYRCEEQIEGSQKLAMAYDSIHERTTAIIETKGEGGYTIVSPSNGYQLQSGSFDEMPVISLEERNFIISECRKFNEIIEKEYESIPQDTERTSNYGNGDRVGDRYNTSSSGISECRKLLIDEGWHFDKDGVSCSRPGKKLSEGISATLGKVHSRSGLPQFYVFSSNAAPFEANTGYTLLAVRTTLMFAGDYAQSVIDLAKQDGTCREPVVVTKVILPPIKEEKRNMDVNIPKFILETEQKINNIDSRMGANGEEVPLKKKTPKIDDAEKFLNERYNFRLDVISNKVEWKPKPSLNDWSLCNESTIYRHLQHNGIDFRKDAIGSLMGSDYIPEYNPFKTYFNSLPEWDGINYFELLADYVTVDDRAFFVAMLEKQFVRAIKCALEDDFYNRFAFIFENRVQENGKSRLIRWMNPFGDKYYSEQPLGTSKDTQIALTRTFIYNLDDLDDLKDAGSTGRLKSTMAKYSVNERLPYGKQEVLLYRHCTFFGSTNRKEFLKDDINTRWLIFGMKMLNTDLFVELDVHKLWCQAWAKYKNPVFEWDLTIEEKQKREEKNLFYRETLIEQQIIATYFQVPDNKYKTETITDIMKKMSLFVQGYSRINTDLTYIQDILGGMGFEPEVKLVMNTYIKSYHIELKPEFLNIHGEKL